MLVYGHQGYPVILFPSSMGRYYESKDFGLIHTAHWFVERGFIQIFCPDSIDVHSWYNKHIHPAQRARNHAWYDKMVLEEIAGRVRWNTGAGKVRCRRQFRRISCGSISPLNTHMWLATCFP